MGVKLNDMIKDSKDEDKAYDLVMSLYTSSMLTSGYQFTAEESLEFSERISALVYTGLEVEKDAPLAEEIEVPDEPEEEEGEEGEEEEEEKEEGSQRRMSCRLKAFE